VPAPAIPADAGSVRVQFIDSSTSSALAAPILLPLGESSVKNLALLLNSLKGVGADERVPYKFSVVAGGGTSSAGPPARVDVTRDLYTDWIVGRRAGGATETTIDVAFTPQAVFRVRAVNRCAAAVPGHGQSILCTQFSPAGASRMCSGSGDGTARIWDCDTGTPFRTLKGHADWVLVVSYSPDGGMIATGSKDKTVRLWDAESGKELTGSSGPLRGHTQFVRSIAWEPYHCQQPGRPRFASASKDGTIRVWDAVGKRIEHVLSGHKSSVSCVRWGGTGQIYSSGHDKTIKIWDAERGTLIRTLAAHAHQVNHLALSTDAVLRTAWHDPQRRGGPAETEEGKRTIARERFEKAALRSGEVSERLVSASDDNTIFLWHGTASKSDESVVSKPIARLLGHQKMVNHVTFSPDGAMVASASFDNSVKLWSGFDGTFVTTLRAHVGPVYMCAFSADSRLLVSASKDTTLKVWDVGGGSMVKGRKTLLREDLPGHKDEVFAVDWSPDGAKVGSGGADKAVRIWSA